MCVCRRGKQQQRQRQTRAVCVRAHRSCTRCVLLHNLLPTFRQSHPSARQENARSLHCASFVLNPSRSRPNKLVSTYELHELHGVRPNGARKEQRSTHASCDDVLQTMVTGGLKVIWRRIGPQSFERANDRACAAKNGKQRVVDHNRGVVEEETRCD